MLETRGVYAVDLEIRQDGERPTIAGRFPYGGLATIAASGRRRRERFSPGAFAPALDREAQEINFLLGHDMARPLASRNAGTFTLEDTPEALTFEAVLPPEGEQTTWQRDFLLAHGQGLLRGVSPGFNVYAEGPLPQRGSRRTRTRTPRPVHSYDQPSCPWGVFSRRPASLSRRNPRGARRRIPPLLAAGP